MDLTPDPQPSVSVIMPILNEERHLRDAVAMILAQDYTGPLEVVLALGPSTDRTDEVAADLAAADARVRVVANPSGRTPDGLNAAIGASTRRGHRPRRRSRGDPRRLHQRRGCRAAPGRRRQRRRSHGRPGHVGLRARRGRAMRSPLGVGSARFHTGGEAGDADTVYLGVFRRAALERVGGYDPHFARAQDWEMNHRIRETGRQGVVHARPQGHLPPPRVRPGPRQAVLPLRPVAPRRRAHHEGTINPRYLAPPTMVGVTTVATIAGFVWPPAWIVPAAYAAGVTAGGLAISRGEAAATRAVTPVVLATMHWSWGIGFLTSPSSLKR